MAELVEVTKQAVSKYEMGDRSPGPDVLLRIASVLRVPVDYFTLPEREPNEATIFFRSLAAATKGARIRGRRRMDWLADITTFLAGYVEFPQVGVPELETAPEDAAATLRSLWGLGESPLSNLAWTLESNGAILTRGYIDARTIDAFSRWYPIGRPLIFLAADKANAVRSRFDAAHELGHMVMHRHMREREFQKGEEFKRVEQEANEFASAFLLPPDSFIADLWNPGLDSMRHIKPKWGASIAAMIMRSEQLGIITEGDATRLRIAAARRGWSRNEPLDDALEVEEPRLLRRSIELLVSEGILTKEAVARSITLGAMDIEALTNLPEGYLADSEAPVRLLDRVARGKPTDDGIRGAVVPFRPRGDEDLMAQPPEPGPFRDDVPG